MSATTKIEWTDVTWNPVSGCTKVSPGCDHCLTPDTPVLLADLTFRPIGEIVIGDQVAAFDEEPQTPGKQRAFRVATVTATWRSRRSIYEVTTSDGHVVRASGEHRWLSGAYGGDTWRYTKHLRVGTAIASIGPPTEVKIDPIYGRRATFRATRVTQRCQVGEGEVVDITTTTGTFIAAGMATHNCYAERITERFHGPGSFAEVTLHPERLETPLRWRKPRRVFVNSMSDLFHDQVPDEFIASVFAAMAAAPEHTFQILTKRHGRMRALLSRPDFHIVAVGKDGAAPWPLPNVWMGVSVEDQRWADIRVPALLDTPAAMRFLSCEPLLGPVDLSPWLWWPIKDGSFRSGMPRRALHWVIAGGESGPGARPMHPDWARALRDQARAADAAFFFKQWGEFSPDLSLNRHVANGRRLKYHRHWWNGKGPAMDRVGSKTAGRVLDGRTWDEYPQQVPL